MSTNRLLLNDILVIRCDSIIDSCYGFDPAYEDSVVNQLIDRFFPSKTIPIVDLRQDHLAHVDTKKILQICLESPERRIIITVDPTDVKLLTSSLSAISSNKLFAIAAVSIPSVMRSSDAEFVLGLAFGALCAAGPEATGVSIAALPSAIGDKQEIELAANKKSSVDNDKWLFKKGSGIHYSESDRITPVNSELLTRWLVTSTADSTYAQADFYGRPVAVHSEESTTDRTVPEEMTTSGASTILGRYFSSILNAPPETWLEKHIASKSESRADSECDFVMATSQLERSNSIHSCDLVPDIEELAICSAYIPVNGELKSTPSDASSTPSSASARTLKSQSNSSWLKVICRGDPQACANMSECLCEPNCSAALFENSVPAVKMQPAKEQPPPSSITFSSMFSVPFNALNWLKSSSKTEPSEPEVKITDKNESMVFPPANDLQRWLAPKPNECPKSEDPWLLASQQNKAMILFNDDGLKSDNAKDSFYDFYR